MKGRTMVLLGLAALFAAPAAAQDTELLYRAGPNLNEIDPLQLEAVEVYTGLETPPQYSRGDRCGVILVWTRRGI